MKIVKYDKDRRRKIGMSKSQRLDPIKVLTIAGIIIALLSSTIWLIQDARDLSETFRPAEGSLVVNINTASSEELISVPGIGATRAAQIIAGRPYTTVDELAKIAGIGGKTLESLRPFVTVEGETKPFE